MKSCFNVLLMLVLSISLVGCGAKTFESVAVEPLPTVPPAQKAKTLLEGVASSGQLGSGAMELQTILEELKTTDAAKADQLLSDLKQLEAMPEGPGKAAKAKEMAAKL
jgi:hypothetical protein